MSKTKNGRKTNNKHEEELINSIEITERAALSPSINSAVIIDSDEIYKYKKKNISPEDVKKYKTVIKQEVISTEVIKKDEELINDRLYEHMKSIQQLIEFIQLKNLYNYRKIHPEMKITRDDYNTFYVTIQKIIEYRSRIKSDFREFINYIYLYQEYYTEIVKKIKKTLQGKSTIVTVDVLFEDKFIEDKLNDEIKKFKRDVKKYYPIYTN